MATWAIGKTFHVIRGLVQFALSFLSFQSGLTSLCFDDYVKYWECFSLNSISCVTRGKIILAFWREIQPTDVCKITLTQIFMQKKIWSNILTARWRASAWSDKMNRRQSADDPLVDLIRVKNMLNSTISMSYPDVAAIAYRTSVWKTFRQLRHWWSTIIIWRIIPWWLTITITANRQTI